MQQRPRIYYSAFQKAMMWDRWQRGESLLEPHHFFVYGQTSAFAAGCQ